MEMVESNEMQHIGSVNIENIIVFGSLTVSLGKLPASIAPTLPFAEVGAILEDGRPNLMSALRWAYRLTDTLHGRESDLDGLASWAENGGNTVSVRLITGPGGAGKTRLAAEAARRLRQRGWCAGFLPRSAPHGQVIDTSGRAGGGLLLVIDYPEERPGLVDELLQYVTDIASSPIPIRFLLVSRRSFNEWRPWADVLGGRFGIQALAAPGPLELSEASAVLRDAATSFAKLTGVRGPSLEGTEKWLARDTANCLPLIAMAAGVHAVLTNSNEFALGAPELMHEIARREQTRVRRVSRSRGLGEYGLERLLGVAILSPEGLDPVRVKELGALDITPGLAGQALLDAVRATPWWVCSPVGGCRLPPIEPDRPAAAFLALALLDDPQPGLPDWLYTAAQTTKRDFEPTLGRLAWDLAALSRDGQGSAPLDRALLEMIDRAPERAKDFWDGFRYTTAYTASFGARVLEEALKAEQDEQDPRSKYSILNSLTTAYHRSGRLDEALGAATQLVKFARQSGNLTHIARALATQTPYLGSCGRHEYALTAISEAVELGRLLVSNLEDPFTSQFARMQFNQSVVLYDLKRYKEALKPALKSVKLYRQLSAKMPSTFTSELPIALNTLANVLAKIGQANSALNAACEAVELFRALAKDRPDDHTSGLALTLNTLSNRLSDLGRTREAITAAKESLEYYLLLVAAHPETASPEMARPLNNLANRYGELDQHEDAFVVATEALEKLSPAFLAHPDAWAPLMTIVIRVYETTCNAASKRPSDALLAPIKAAFEKNEGA